MNKWIVVTTINSHDKAIRRIGEIVASRGCAALLSVIERHLGVGVPWNHYLSFMNS